MQNIKKKKQVIIGNGFCGKTSLLMVFKNNRFPEHYTPNVFDNYTVEIELNDSLKIIQLELWDTAGQEEYEILRLLILSEYDNPGSLTNISE